MDIAEEFAMSKFASSADRNAALLDEIERLRLDAARYRWLREHGGIRAGAYNAIALAMTGVTDEDRIALDAAIDAAMKG